MAYIDLDPGQNIGLDNRLNMLVSVRSVRVAAAGLGGGYLPGTLTRIKDGPIIEAINGAWEAAHPGAGALIVAGRR